MVMASRRTYADAVAWTKSTRPPDFSRARFALDWLGAFFLAGIIAFGVASVATPQSFGQRGARVLNLGWPSVALVAMIAVSLIVLVVNRRRLASLMDKNLTSPFSLRPGQDRAYEAAVNALSACPRLFQLRFFAGWIWGPGAIAFLGAILAVSAAYYAVYSVLAGFDVGAETASLAIGNVLGGLVLFMLGAVRLATWRFAATAYRTVSPSYLG